MYCFLLSNALTGLSFSFLLCMKITLSFQVEVLRKELVIQAEKQQRVKQQVNEFCFKNTSGSEEERQLEACKKEMQGRHWLGDHKLRERP